MMLWPTHSSGLIYMATLNLQITCVNSKVVTIKCFFEKGVEKVEQDEKNILIGHNLTDKRFLNFKIHISLLCWFANNQWEHNHMKEEYFQKKLLQKKILKVEINTPYKGHKRNKLSRRRKHAQCNVYPQCLD